MRRLEERRRVDVAGIGHGIRAPYRNWRTRVWHAWEGLARVPHTWSERPGEGHSPALAGVAAIEIPPKRTAAKETLRQTARLVLVFVIMIRVSLLLQWLRPNWPQRRQEASMRRGRNGNAECVLIR